MAYLKKSNKRAKKSSGREWFRKAITVLLTLMISVAFFPLVSSNGRVFASDEMVEPTISLSKTTYNVGERVTFSWKKTGWDTTNFKYYHVMVDNYTYPNLNVYVGDSILGEDISDRDDNQRSFVADKAGIYSISVQTCAHSDVFVNNKENYRFIKVGDPLTIENISINANNNSISGSFYTQYNTTGTVTIDPVSGQGGSTIVLRNNNITNTMYNNNTYNERYFCSFNVNRENNNYTCGNYKVTIKTEVGEFTKTASTNINISHAWDAGKVTKAATCHTDGIKTYKCATCGETQTEVIPATPGSNHTWDAGKVTKAATCTATGVKTITCTGCGTTKTSAIAKKGHVWDSGRVTRPAKYFSTGVKTYTCQSCKATKTATIPKKNVAAVTPARVTITSAKPAKKKVTVKWKRVAKNTKGYQIALKNKNTGKTTNYKVGQSSKSVLSKTIKKLQSKKTYAIRIRAYNVIGSETIYGPWSNVKSGKVK